mmetsp:Transcript_24179/g.65484  ORF Transcript_24179/g.65484 Transcript_24179/m.65484 type:complete len:271 (-) Transcript_24179:776-1588(-)
MRECAHHLPRPRALEVVAQIEVDETRELREPLAEGRAAHGAEAAAAKLKRVECREVREHLPQAHRPHVADGRVVEADGLRLRPLGADHLCQEHRHHLVKAARVHLATLLPFGEAEVEAVHSQGLEPVHLRERPPEFLRSSFGELVLAAEVQRRELVHRGQHVRQCARALVLDRGVGEVDDLDGVVVLELVLRDGLELMRREVPALEVACGLVEGVRVDGSGHLGCDAQRHDVEVVGVAQREVDAYAVEAHERVHDGLEHTQEHGYGSEAA